MHIRACQIYHAKLKKKPQIKSSIATQYKRVLHTGKSLKILENCHTKIWGPQSESTMPKIAN